MTDRGAVTIISSSSRGLASKLPLLRTVLTELLVGRVFIEVMLAYQMRRLIEPSPGVTFPSLGTRGWIYNISCFPIVGFLSVWHVFVVTGRAELRNERKKMTSQCESASSVVLVELSEDDIYSIW